MVPEPVLTRLEACYDEVASLAKMRSGVLVWRRIATADVAAFGATPQMEPPLASSKTLDTSRSTWNGVRVNAFRYVAHCRSASVRSSGRTPTVLCYRRLVMPSQRGPLRVQTPHRKRPGPCSRDEDEHIWANGAAEVGVSFAAQIYLQSLQGRRGIGRPRDSRGQTTKGTCSPSSGGPPSPLCTESARSSRGQHPVSRVCRWTGRLP